MVGCLWERNIVSKWSNEMSLTLRQEPSVYKTAVVTEITGGIRQALAHPRVYDCFQSVVGAFAWRKAVINEFVNGAIQDGGLIIDIGCGTCKILNYVTQNVEYIGFDRNQSYIDHARKRYAHRNASFANEELSADFDLKGRKADFVLAFGLLHHLNDEDSSQLFNVARRFLRDAGSLLTLDPVYIPRQSRVARYIISKDRGTAVRSEAAYKALAYRYFKSVESYINLSPLRIPYTGIVMKCSG